MRGTVGAHSFAVYYLAAGQIIAVDAVNSPHDFMLGKKLVTAGRKISAAELSDPATDLVKLAG